MQISRETASIREYNSAIMLILPIVIVCEQNANNNVDKFCTAIPSTFFIPQKDILINLSTIPR